MGLMLSDAEFDHYTASLEPHQAGAISAVRNLIRELNPGVVERIDDGKWFVGLLTYSTPEGAFLYALGPRSGRTTFHMMAYYGSKALQERHGPSLKPFLTGKSCIRFDSFEQLPEGALRDIIEGSPEWVLSAMKQRG